MGNHFFKKSNLKWTISTGWSKYIKKIIFFKFIKENIIFQWEHVIDFDYKSVLVNDKMWVGKIGTGLQNTDKFMNIECVQWLANINMVF